MFRKEEGNSLVLLAALGTMRSRRGRQSMALKTKVAKDGEGQGQF